MRSFAVLVAALALIPAAGATATASPLCAPLSPPRTPLPKAIPVRLSNYTFELSANARAHHGLCSVGLSSPGDGYLYSIEWDVFPSHALAVADLDAVSPSAIYGTISSKAPARGFPAPNYELTGTGRASGKPVTDVTFVDGTALVSAYIYFRSDFSETLALARWASRNLALLTRRR
ncbi:MAG TPA: hypothetical protein VH063_16515 [Gaiellaceae bacterium]|jgi:hypothetical protein|nr:hypothetical protein [Gaiellaceae bacterium]